MICSLPLGTCCTIRARGNGSVRAKKLLGGGWGEKARDFNIVWLGRFASGVAIAEAAAIANRAENHADVPRP